MIRRLSALLKHAFAPSRDHEASLAEELRVLDLYLDIMRLRFTERLFVQIDDGTGLIYAEALQFRLAAHIPRPQAQQMVKDLCKSVMAGQGSLAALAADTWPDIDTADVFDPTRQLGEAPEMARRFAKAARNPKAAQE